MNTQIINALVKTREIFDHRSRVFTSIDDYETDERELVVAYLPLHRKSFYNTEWNFLQTYSKKQHVGPYPAKGILCELNV